MKIKSIVIAKIAMIAAVYSAATLVIPMTSFSLVQIRFSEALTVLAAISPIGVFGITLGCFISNFVGLLIGLNPMPLDILFGTLATFLSAFASYFLRNIKIKNIPFLIWIPPVIINGLILSVEFTFLALHQVDSPAFMNLFLTNFSVIALGQLIPCLVLGMPLYCLTMRTKLKNLII